jgi:hypothetical protein
MQIFLIKKRVFLMFILLSFFGCRKQRISVKSTPVENNDGTYSVYIGNQSIEMNPAIGGRITSLKLNGEDFLTGPNVNRFNWGSTFWPSPQSVWKWPPPAAIDNEPYEASIENKTVKMVSSKALKSGFVATKEFSGNKKGKYYTLDYIITNQSDSTQKVAPWEVTRVRPGCLIFFPKGKGQMTGSLVPLTVKRNGIVWLRYNRAKIHSVGGDHQIWANGSEGWIAVVNNGIIFVKKFPDVPLKKIAPGEGDVQIFATSSSKMNRNYVEIEPEGPYEQLAPADSLTWKVRWYLRKLPESIKVEIGNSSLVTYVRNLVH